MRDEILKLRGKLRRAYRDAGRMATAEYNGGAHRIEDVEARLEATGMIGENTSMRFQDGYRANTMAVNDIFDM